MLTTMQGALRRFTIRTRMQGAVAMVLAMFAVVGATGVVGGLQLQALNQHMVAHSLGETRAVAEVRQHLMAVRLHEQQMVIDYENTDAVKALRTQWQAGIAATGKALQGLVGAEDDADNALAHDAIEKLQAYESALQPVLSQVEAAGYDNAGVVDRQFSRARQHVLRVTETVDKIDANVTAEAEATTAASDRTMQAVLWSFGGALGLMLVTVVPLTLLNSRSITAPIHQARAAALAIAAGDLTQPIAAEGADETAELLRALGQMQASLQRVVGEVRHTADSIAVASAEVASGNNDLSRRTEVTAGSLQQTASSMAQITGSVQHSADAARQAQQLAAEATQVAQQGGTAVAGVVSTMGEIDASSKKIADIIGTIDGIAFQTNILALNAAVEAARAGEQGRGFAVVAAEVRSLAQRSAGAAREIKGLIGASVERVDSGARQVRDAGATMAQIVASVQRVTRIVGEITASAAEQSNGIGQVNQAVGELDQMTQQNAALVEQSAAAAESLKSQAQRLTETVAAFRLPASHAA